MVYIRHMSFSAVVEKGIGFLTGHYHRPCPLSGLFLFFFVISVILLGVFWGYVFFQRPRCNHVVLCHHDTSFFLLFSRFGELEKLFCYSSQFFRMQKEVLVFLYALEAVVLYLFHSVNTLQSLSFSPSCLIHRDMCTFVSNAS